MDVDDPPAVGAETAPPRVDAHVPRQTDQIDPRGIEPRRRSRVRSRPRHTPGAKAKQAMPGAAARSVTRAPGRSQTTSATLGRDRTPPGMQRRSPRSCSPPLAKTAIRFIGTLPDDDFESVTRPMTDACSPCDARMSTAFCASSASSAMTMPTPMLKMLNISRWAIFRTSGSGTRAGSPTSLLDGDAPPLVQDTGNVLVESAAGDVADAVGRRTGGSRRAPASHRFSSG